MTTEEKRRWVTMNGSTIMKGQTWIIGALLACGCAGSQPASTTPQMAPAESEMAPAEDVYDSEVPPQQGPETPQQGPETPQHESAPGAEWSQQSSNEPTTNAVTQEEIDEFADTQIVLIELQEQYSQQAQAGASQEELQQLQNQLQQQMDQLLRESSLDPERYNEIAAQIQGDQDLMQQVQKTMQQKTGGS